MECPPLLLGVSFCHLPPADQAAGVGVGSSCGLHHNLPPGRDPSHCHNSLCASLNDACTPQKCSAVIIPSLVLLSVLSVCLSHVPTPTRHFALLTHPNKPLAPDPRHVACCLNGNHGRACQRNPFHSLIITVLICDIFFTLDLYSPQRPMIRKLGSTRSGGHHRAFHYDPGTKWLRECG